MPIAALPQNTVRAIGSTSVISDPCSIVKELLDNSLDAGATAVVIEISQNTVDVIQVKDNGHGIASEDHRMVCKRAYTSKISTVEDLRGLGGSSLGFRGEALASAVEVSAGVTITTRTANEPVGSILKYGRNGELASTQRSSHPVGTTVRIIDLFKRIPVRRQTVLKGTTKTLSRIKKTIQSYAIAQPAIRLSLKVLKASNEKVNWVYAPRSDAELMDAALKVAGTEVATACISRQWPCNNSDDGPGASGEPVLKMIALLVNPEADVSKVNNGGQFFSVDGRPLASSRGIAQEMTKLYKAYLRAAASRNDHLVNISDPFLCLHIRCDEACYDVNVEPAKDDVLFEDQKEILSLMKALLRDVYGEIPGETEKPNTYAKGKERMANNDAFDLLLAHKEPLTSSTELVNNNHKSPNMISASSLFHMRGRQKNGINEQRASVGEGSLRLSGISGRRDLEGLNPWSVTRLYTLSGASSHRNLHENPAIRGQLSHAVQDFDLGSSVIVPHPDSVASSSSPSAPTPNSRVVNSPADSRSSGSVSNPTQTSPITPLQTPSIYSRASRERDRERYGNGALDTWFQKTTQISLREKPIGQQPENEADEVSLSQLAQERFAENETLPRNSLGTVAASPTPILANKSPESIPSYQVSTPSRNRASGTAPRRLDQWSAKLHQQPSADHNPELERALDFENRKRQAMLKFREQRKNTGHTSSNSPHLSRYLAAKAALNPKPTNTPEQSTQESDNNMSQSRLNPHDPRAYLIRHLVSPHNPQEASRDLAKTRRLNTSKLPLEKIPDGYDLHDVCLVQPVDLSLITETFQELSTRDLYTRNEDRWTGFSASDRVHVDSWIGKIGTLIKERYHTTPGSGIPVIDINLSDLQQGLRDLE